MPRCRAAAFAETVPENIYFQRPRKVLLYFVFVKRIFLVALTAGCPRLGVGCSPQAGLLAGWPWGLWRALPQTLPPLSLPAPHRFPASVLEPAACLYLGEGGGGGPLRGSCRKVTFTSFSKMYSSVGQLLCSHH